MLSVCLSSGLVFCTVVENMHEFVLRRAARAGFEQP